MIWAISALLVGGLLVLAGFVLLTLEIRRINRTFEDLELEQTFQRQAAGTTARSVDALTLRLRRLERLHEAPALPRRDESTTPPN